MTGPHLSDETLDAFVSGASTPEEDARVSEHAASCPSCAGKLARFARHEEVIEAVAQARQSAPPPAPRRPFVSRRARRIAFAAAALAACVAVAVFLSGDPNDVPSVASEGIPPVICPDGSDQQACVQDARARGLFIAYPALGAPDIGAAPIAVNEWSLE